MLKYLLLTDSRFPIPDSRFPIPDSRFPIPDSRFPVPCSLTICKLYFVSLTHLICGFG
ncbi:MAG: hypothetical protein F6K50_27710 [Moorea sp. SIO3I7]|uniref:hypothetical protein n=1 Tax=Moorena sp. SIO3I8 TaxID=2607833 RepID=UPI0013BF21D7|nr:hypothetical protein [Moorena sp. SIO3I8]NEN99137.1 hypothetical protein [Moorena sp. SIO3I7]NEO04287.1 hypothetical protein [Moorena sp. SIO3I8]